MSIWIYIAIGVVLFMYFMIWALCASSARADAQLERWRREGKR